MRARFFGLMIGLLLSCAVSITACNNDPENTGLACEVPGDCYPDVDPANLAGEIQCLADRVDGGYCTHMCISDAECCAVDGECLTGIPQVCAPFESLDGMRCFLSCEREDIGDMDATAYCQEYAHPAFGCRSTGGGSDNRRVCLPN